MFGPVSGGSIGTSNSCGGKSTLSGLYFRKVRLSGVKLSKVGEWMRRKWSARKGSQWLRFTLRATRKPWGCFKQGDEVIMFTCHMTPAVGPAWMGGGCFGGRVGSHGRCLGAWPEEMVYGSAIRLHIGREWKTGGAGNSKLVLDILSLRHPNGVVWKAVEEGDLGCSYIFKDH